MLPGGNSRITERLCQDLTEELGNGALRSQQVVTNVHCVDTRVEIHVSPLEGEPYLLRAPAAVVACPKFVAKRIVQGCTYDQYATMQSLKYRAYLTANVIIKGQPKYQFYDMFLLKPDAKGQPYPPTTPLSQLAATDAILANWVLDHPTHSVVTLYRALPFDAGRTTLLSDSSYDGVRSAFERQISDEILPALHFTSNDIVDTRITRWGHALPVATPGFIASAGPEIVSAPVDGRIFFAQQDNWALPALEVALAEAISAASQVHKVIGG